MVVTILLLNPPSPDGICADREAMYGMGVRRPPYATAQPPHLLAWCGAQLHDTDWRVYGLDAVAEGLDELTTIFRIQNIRPTIIITTTSVETATEDAAFFAAARKHLPETCWLLVSHAARFLPPRITENTDMVLIGEPEGAVYAACVALLDDDGLRGATSAQLLEGAAYDVRNALIDISYLAPPAWDLFDLSYYDRLPILSARGCNYGCRYCAAPRTQGTLRVRLAERVAAEMQLVLTRHRIRDFYFIDPLFAADRVHVTALLRAIERRGLGEEVRWQCETRPECLDVPLIRRMKRAGCRVIRLGLESVSPGTLTMTGRIAHAEETGDYLARVRQILLACRAYGVECHLYVMAGLPGDRAGATATRAFLRAYAAHNGQVGRHIPYPGTVVYPTTQIEEEWEILRSTVPQVADTAETVTASVEPIAAS